MNKTFFECGQLMILTPFLKIELPALHQKKKIGHNLLFSFITKSCPELCNSMDTKHQAHLSSAIFCSLLEFMFIKLVMLSNHLTLCHCLLFLPSIFPSIRIFSNELAVYIRWPKYWSFSFSISLFNEYSGLIFFKLDWFDFFAVQGTL